MKKLSKNFIFYFVIMEENKNDHIGLRQLIQSIVPQVIIESIYDFNEAVTYFRLNKTRPHVLFISEEMSKAGMNIAADGSIHDLSLESLPFVFLSDKKPVIQMEQRIYSKPYDSQNFLSIVGSMNHKWVA